MNNNEVIKHSEQNNNQPTGWEKVAAMADKMSQFNGSEKTPNNPLKEENSNDAMVDMSGRKYQSILTNAESITAEKQENIVPTADKKIIKCYSQKMKILLIYTIMF